MRSLLARVDRALMERPACAMCLAVSGAAFFAAVLTAMVNVLLPGLLAAFGMLVVSLLYLGLAFACRDDSTLGTVDADKRPCSLPATSVTPRLKVDSDRDIANPKEHVPVLAEPDDEMMLPWRSTQPEFSPAVLPKTLPHEGLAGKDLALGHFRVTVTSAPTTKAQQLGSEQFVAAGTTPSCNQGRQA